MDFFIGAKDSKMAVDLNERTMRLFEFGRAVKNYK